MFICLSNVQTILFFQLSEWRWKVEGEKSPKTEGCIYYRIRWSVMLKVLVHLIIATIMSDQGFSFFVLNPCNATTLSRLDTGSKHNYAFIMNNIDKSNPNVPENDQNWIEIVVMAIIYT